MKRATILAALMAGCGTALTACKRSEACGPDAERRERWLQTPNRAYDQGRAVAPHDQGYRTAGACSTIIEERELDCANQSGADSPQLRDALALGFTTHRCIELPSERAVDRQLASVIRDAIQANILSMVRGFVTKVCACKDQRCATAVMEEYGKWGQESVGHIKPGDPLAAPDADMAKKIGDATQRMSACMTEIATLAFNDVTPQWKRCREAIGKSMRRIAPQQGDEADAVRRRYSVALTPLCAEDNWSAAALACIAGSEPSKCKLTDVQAKRLSAALDRLSTN